MKTKNKVLASVEIAVVLCSVFLIALPSIAAEQNQEIQKTSAFEVTTASEDNYVLDIYGNANEDDTIDMRDLTYVKLIFFGKKPETELADAKYDGKVNPLDFIQIKLIIVGKEKELTLIDTGDRIVTIKKPVKRAITLHSYGAEAIRMFGEKDKIIGIGDYVKKYSIYFPEINKLPSVGVAPYDLELMLELKPELVIEASYTARKHNLEEKLPDSIALVCLDFSKSSIYKEELKKLGYIFGKEDKVDNYLSIFHDKYVDLIKSQTEKLPEEEKPKVYMESCSKNYRAYGGGSGANQYIKIAGGKNIFADLDVSSVYVDPEEVIMRNPDIILRYICTWTGENAGYTTDDPSDIKAKREEIMNRPELANVNAVRNGKVYIIENGLLYGLDYPIGIVYLAKWFQPDIFKDLNPQAIHQEFIDRFCPGLDFDVYKHGAFVYPPSED